MTPLSAGIANFSCLKEEVVTSLVHKVEVVVSLDSALTSEPAFCQILTTASAHDECQAANNFTYMYLQKLHVCADVRKWAR